MLGNGEIKGGLQCSQMTLCGGIDGRQAIDFRLDGVKKRSERLNWTGQGRSSEQGCFVGHVGACSGQRAVPDWFTNYERILMSFSTHNSRQKQ